MAIYQNCTENILCLSRTDELHEQQCLTLGMQPDCVILSICSCASDCYHPSTNRGVRLGQERACSSYRWM